MSLETKEIFQNFNAKRKSYLSQKEIMKALKKAGIPIALRTFQWWQEKGLVKNKGRYNKYVLYSSDVVEEVMAILILKHKYSLSIKDIQCLSKPLTKKVEEYERSVL